MAEKISEAIQESKKIDLELKQEKLRRELEVSAAEAGKAPDITNAGVSAKAPQAAKTPEEKEGKKEAEKKIVLERTFVIPLSKAYRKPRSHRARIAVSLLKQFVARHAKTALASVRVGAEVNSIVQSRGSRHPPKRVRVRIAKDEAGVAEVYLAK